MPEADDSTFALIAEIEEQRNMMATRAARLAAALSRALAENVALKARLKELDLSPSSPEPAALQSIN